MATPTKDNNGKYPSFAWPGAYPLYYLDRENSCLCPDCANKDQDIEKFQVVACDVHWEGEPMICDECGKSIESAYGIPENQ